MNFLTDLFHPHPPAVDYSNPRVVVLLLVMLLLLVASSGIRFWHKRLANPVTKKLARSWSSTLLWFGIVGVVLVVSRAEDVLFLSMRFLWVLWLAALLLYAAFQAKQFRTRHYEVLPKQRVEDPREKYLPK